VNRRDFTFALAAGGATLMAGRRLRWPAARAEINAARLNARLAELSQFGRNPQGGVTRLAYSDADRQARALVMQWMRDARLEPTIDFAGNIIGRRSVAGSSRPPLVFGSHVDSVPEGGNYDGNVGSLASIEVAQVLAEQGTRLRHPMEIVVWANEEGGLYGSRAVGGDLQPKELANVALSGKTIEAGMAFLGGDPARLDRIRRKRGDIAGYLELHIEQGGVLERASTNIGVVEGIVGIARWDVTVTGFANHAGTTPMDQRQDALLSSARFIQMVNETVRAEPGRQVGTVGRIEASPGAPNVIPGQVRMSLELRDLDIEKARRIHDSIVERSRRIGAENGTAFAFREVNIRAGAPSDPRVRSIIAESSRALKLSAREMPSGAGHDAQVMAALGPMGMIFIPSIGGISHSPKEYSTPADIANGANVLLGAVLAMDASIT
jgi:N-carbamoyl-L-amino-acid hydrolase